MVVYKKNQSKSKRNSKDKNKKNLIFILSAFFLFLNSFLASAQQQNSVSISVSNVSLQQFFEEIEKASPYRFSYRDVVLENKKDVSINISNRSIESVLNSVLPSRGLQYAVNGISVIITKNIQTESAQDQKRIIGVVRDQMGEPIIGANVLEKGTINGVTTDLDGNFQIQASSSSVLIISYIGYTPIETSVGNKTSFTITMSEDTQVLEEVVIIGYGTQRKKDLTGAVASIGGNEVTSRKTTQVSQALQGAISGVSVTRSNNSPGSGATIRVRGVTTIGNTEPLIIVDGMQISNINDVNPNDIESISVLKDAASSSIYGSQAAAGVILISTKRAKIGQFGIEYNYEYGMEIPTSHPKSVGVIRFMEMTNELRWNDAGNGTNEYPTYSKDMIDNYFQLNKDDPNKYPNTDWRGLMLKSYAPRQSHIVKLSGGTDKLRTAASIGYDDLGALYENKSYQRITFRVNNDFKFNEYLSASLDVNFKRTIDKQPSMDPMHFTSISAPVYAAKWSDGRIAEGKTGANIYAQTKYGGYNHYWYNQVGSRASLDFTPIKGLKISGVFAPTLNSTKAKKWRTAVPWFTADDPSVRGGFTQWGSTTSLGEERNDNYQLTTQFLANYDNTIGLHSLNILAGYENRYEFHENLGASRGNYELTSYPYLDIGPMELRDNGGNAGEYARRSYFGRVMYGYDNKYLLQVNARYDGSSRFHKDNRWGFFPSVSAGWVLSEESFMKDIDFLSFLKLRASWGSLGNERIGDYAYHAKISYANSLLFAGDDVISKLGAAQWTYVIRDITWETTESFDIGFDVNFLKNRLRINADYYKKNTKDMLLALQIPTYMGFDNPQQNTGKMHTTGWELQVNWNDRIGDVYYNVGFNIDDDKSKMGDLGGTQFLGDKIKIQGSEFDEWYGYKSLGIYQTQEQVDNSAKTSNSVKVGDVWYEDISGPDGVPDGKISAEYDRVLLGGSRSRFNYGFNLGVSYKNFDFGLFIQGVGKQNSRISGEMVEPLRENWGNVPSILDGNVYSYYNTAEQNLKMKYPRLTVTNLSNNNAMSDFWMFNGWYMRLKNVNLGYTLPQDFVKKMHLQNMRFYVSASDLFFLSSYPQGWDPEMRSGEYPITTSIVFGASVKF